MLRGPSGGPSGTDRGATTTGTDDQDGRAADPGSERLVAQYAALARATPEELLAPLLAATGGTLRQAAREDIVFRPGRDAHVRLAALVERGGVEAVEGWVVAAAVGALPDGTLTVQGPAGPVAAWRVRDDPGLPGLGPALDLTAVTGLLESLGVPTAGLSVELVSVRPQRRAVVEVLTDTSRLFLKLVRPEDAALLHRRHLACSAAGLPVPRPMGLDPARGLLVLSPVHGTPLRDLLLADDAGALPPAQQVVDLVRGFADVELDLPARDVLRQCRGHARLLREVLPGSADRVADLAGRIAGAGPDVRDTVVHGDLYDAQLLVEGGVLRGVVDVDGSGVGAAADDAGTLLAHLLVLRGLVPPSAGVHALLPDLVALLTRQHDPAELDRRTAAVLLGLATWPHSRHEQGWEAQTVELVALTERVLDLGLRGA